MTTTIVRPALKATGLRKSFGEKTALDGIDLNVAEGSIFALCSVQTVPARRRRCRSCPR
jgi:ABC-type sugar transport system ATPase subunit